VLSLGQRPQGVVYAVPGHPLVGETSVLAVLKRAADAGQKVRLVNGLSFIEPVLTALGVDGLDFLQLADATRLASSHHPTLEVDRPALVGQLYGRRLASGVKLTLMNAYPADHPVTLVHAAGTGRCEVTTLPLYELDRNHQVGHLTTLFVPALPPGCSLSSLQDTVARLRAPGGCPWDREQTHQTLRSSLLEETYEVLAALDSGDEDKMCEELGDLLMQIAMHTQIATEQGEFQLCDVIGRIGAKLMRRHPHVFGDVSVRDSADVLRNWESIKAAERTHAGEGGSQPSRLDGVPSFLPALARAQALGERAARVGFDWPQVEGVLDKLDEEVAELSAAREAEARGCEFGDLLFTLVNLARWLDVDAESALRAACDRFAERFAAMEREIEKRGVDLSGLSPSQLDALWEAAKEQS
jgi:tetrapyrrole methylase family protein/MazG family protein